jgi:hypothetical protein
MLLLVGDHSTLVRHEECLQSFGLNLKKRDHVCVVGRAEDDGFNFPREGLGM